MKILLSIIALAAASAVNGHEINQVHLETPDMMETDVPAPPQPEKENSFESVETKPEFPGGEAALFRYIADHLKYPASCAEANIQGKVILNILITKTGAVGQVKVVKGIDPDLDKEAVRVAKSLPKFKPGTMNGYNVNVWYSLPITFKLQSI